MNDDVIEESGAELRRVTYTIRFTKEEDDALTEYAEKTFRKKPDVIRMAIAHFFEAEKAFSERGDL